MVVVLLLGNLLILLVVSSVDPADPADISDVVPYDAAENQLYSHTLLPEETSGEPPRWILPHMYGRGGSDDAYLFVRGDNLRIAGYTDQGVWQAFRSAGGLHLAFPARPKRLSFDDDYTSLLGGHEHLRDLRISKESAMNAITELARSKAANRTAADDVGVRRAVATLNVAVFEAQRFTSIWENVNATWEDGGTTLDDRQVELVVGGSWRTMSCALLIAAQNGGAWLSAEAAQLRSIGMFSKEDVLREIRVIMWPKDCSEPINLGRASM